MEGAGSLWSSKLFTPVVVIFILCAVGGMSVRSIRNNLYCAQDQCSLVKDYTDACMISRDLFCCGGTQGTFNCGSYTKCLKLNNPSTEYSMCTPLRVTFWILFVVGLLSLYAGVFLARNFYKSKTGGLLQ